MSKHELKLAISGGVGIGKTTLGIQLADRLELPMIDEGYDSFFDNANSWSGTAEVMIERFNEVLEDKRKRELQHTGFVVDRCPLDLLKSWMNKKTVNNIQASHIFFKKCVHYLNLYDYVILPPWGSIPLQQIDQPQGGKRRVSNPWVQLGNHAKIVGLARMIVGNERMIAIPASVTDLEQRIAFVLKRIQF